jgi:predicted dehydrogenase
MLSKVKPDIVAIGPRHVDQHRDMLLTAIKFGAKGIYIEKPFVRSPAEADEVIDAAQETGVKIAIAHRNRYHPALAMAAKLIADGAIGRVLEMRGRGKEDPRGGSLDMWVLGSHVMGVALALGGAPRACTAGVFQGGKPLTKADVKEGDEGIGLLAGDEVHARFEMANGVPFFFDSIKDGRLKKPAYDDPASFGLQVFGNAGVIDFRMDQEPFAWIQTGSDARKPVLADKDIAKQVSSHEIPGLDLIAAIQENRAPLCDAAHGREITEMISAVFESHRMNGQRVTFPLQTRQNPLTLL